MTQLGVYEGYALKLKVCPYKDGHVSPCFYCDRYLLEDVSKKEGLILATVAEALPRDPWLWAWDEGDQHSCGNM